MSETVLQSLTRYWFTVFVMPSYQRLLCTAWIQPPEVSSRVHCCPLQRKLARFSADVEVMLLSHSWSLLPHDTINAPDSSQD